jgi:hypothetical protein
MRHLDPASAAADAVSTELSAADRRQAASARMDRQMAVLDRLVEIGLEIAEEAGRQARAPAEDRPLVDPGLTYSRAARAVRLTIALQQRLAKDIAGLARDQAYARRNRIQRAVERAIEAERDDADEIETLSEEARERLWDDETFDDLADLTLDEAVALICKDLGLAPAEGWVGEAMAMEDVIASPQGGGDKHKAGVSDAFDLHGRPGMLPNGRHGSCTDEATVPIWARSCLKKPKSFQRSQR